MLNMNRVGKGIFGGSRRCGCGAEQARDKSNFFLIFVLFSKRIITIKIKLNNVLLLSFHVSLFSLFSYYIRNHWVLTTRVKKLPA